jgi:chromosome segregation ATPase
LREKYKEEKAATNKLEKESEKERAQVESSIKRIDDLKKNKAENQKILERLKKEIDKLKNEQIDLENKVTDILGKMAALDEAMRECKKIESELKMVMDQDDKEVKESRIKVEKAKKDVDSCQDECKKQSENLKFA